MSTHVIRVAPIVDFIDGQHEAYMRQEEEPERKETIDLRMHACLYFIYPTGQTRVLLCSRSPSGLPTQSLDSLEPLDIDITKRLGTRVNLIPVVAKPDSPT